MESDHDRMLIAIEKMRNAAMWARAKDIHTGHHHIQKTGPNIMQERGHRLLAEKAKEADKE